MKEQFELQLPELLYFVKASCHESLHDTLRDLSVCMEEMEDYHKVNPEFPKQLSHFVLKFIQNLRNHLAHEEKTLFPSIAAGSSRVNASIPHLVDDHDQMKIDLLAIRRMTRNYQYGEMSDEKLNDFYKLLKEMDRIILNHIQIEDYILFPMLLK